MGQQIPGTIVREGERMVEIPDRGWLQVRSADEPDSLRGEGLDFLVMDECAFIQEAAWNQALRPSLSDRKGGALFISTPKGMNWFWHAWTRGQEPAETEWQSWCFPTVSNPFIDPEEVEAARLGLPERIFQQEYEAQFLEEAGGVFRRVRDAVDAGRTAPDAPRPGLYVCGVDLARVQDFTVITVLDSLGRQVYHERFNQISWERQLAAVARVARSYNATVLLDSTGLGDPIVEALAKEPGIRAEGYLLTNRTKEQLIDALALALENGRLRLMDLPAQTTELLAYQYELTAARNVRMNAPAGMHDDCVIALALAHWQRQELRSALPAVGPPRPALAGMRL